MTDTRNESFRARYTEYTKIQEANEMKNSATEKKDASTILGEKLCFQEKVSEAG